MCKRFLIIGGAGFIGSAVVRHLIRATAHRANHFVQRLDASADGLNPN